MKRSGNSLIEFVLLAPWFFLLFAGVTQVGFTLYGLIAVQNAARVAALHVAANPATATDQAGACALVIEELKGLPNINSTFGGSCNAAPVTVSASYCDSSVPCTGAATSADSEAAAVVTVTYFAPAMVRFPVAGLSSITRTVEMRLRDPLQ